LRLRLLDKTSHRLRPDTYVVLEQRQRAVLNTGVDTVPLKGIDEDRLGECPTFGDQRLFAAIEKLIFAIHIQVYDRYSLLGRLVEARIGRIIAVEFVYPFSLQFH